MEAYDQFNQKVVTNFLLDTCGSDQRLNPYAVSSLVSCTEIAASFPRKDAAADSFNVIPLTTGSIAEFCIRPMLSCIGDNDIMYHHTNQIAVPAGTAPPIQLPGDFDSVVFVSQIVDEVRFPGYVLTCTWCLRTCWQNALKMLGTTLSGVSVWSLCCGSKCRTRRKRSVLGCWNMAQRLSTSQLHRYRY